MIVIYIIAGTLFCTLFYVCILLCRCVTSGKKHRRKDRSTSPGDQLVMVLPYEGALGPIKNDCVYMYFINRHKFNILKPSAWDMRIFNLTVYKRS